MTLDFSEEKNLSIQMRSSAIHTEHKPFARITSAQILRRFVVDIERCHFVGSTGSLRIQNVFRKMNAATGNTFSRQLRKMVVNVRDKASGDHVNDVMGRIAGF